MNPINFHLRAWASWIPGLIVKEAEALPASLRRRITPIGRHALSAVWGLPEIANARLVLSSRHGEFSRTASLLEAIVNDNELSPADFTLSVHHALIGLLSISLSNPRGHSAVAAGKDSFCFGLPLPGAYAVFNDQNEQPIALALVLETAGSSDCFQFDYSAAVGDLKSSVSHAKDFLEFLKNDSMENISIDEHRQWRWKRYAGY
jgi:hypothetical protein